MFKVGYSKGTDCTIIFLGSLLLFTFGLAHEEVVGFDSRLYAFALEMWRHGFGWFPRTFQQYYPDYPVTSSWMIYLLANLFGTLNKLVAVLPSAMAASLTLVVTYCIGALHNRKWALSAVFLLILTLEFTSEARAIAYDQYITLVTACCFYLVYSGKLLSANRRIYLLFPLFVLGFAFRGPIGLVIPTGVVCVFYLLEKNFKNFVIVGVLSALLLVICSAIFLTIAYHTGGMSFLQEVLHTEMLNHIRDLKSNPVYFYFIESVGAYAVTYPLMVLMLPGILGVFSKKIGQMEKQFLLYLLGWIFIILIGLSIPDDKKIRYILPVAPAMALFCAYLFANGIENLYLRSIRRCFYWVCFYFPAICLFALCFFHLRLFFDYLNFPSLVGALVFMQVMMLVFYLLLREKIIGALFLTMLTFGIVYIAVVEPTSITLNSARDIVLKVEDLRAREKVPVVFYREGWDALAVKYFINMPHEEKLFFIATPEELMAYHQPAIFIASVEYVDALPKEAKSHFKPIMSGVIGHDKVVVFRRS